MGNLFWNTYIYCWIHVAQELDELKITDIKQQVRRQDRYSVYADGKYLFSFGESELLNARLYIGQEITEAELHELKDRAVLDKAYDRTLHLIGRRRRSEWEIRQYLKGKEYADDHIEKTINKLSESGYVDDLAFARAWVENRRLLKATSRRRLSQELRAKRVADGIIQSVLEADETSDADVLKQLVEKKRRQTRYQDDLKLMQYLSRQGYSYGDIKSALNED